MTKKMNLVIDVHYSNDDVAIAAGISFSNWLSDSIEDKHIVKIDGVAPYKPGSFFERELPCILALLEAIEEKPQTIVIDGYVTLGAEKRDGLGAHLYRALDSKISIIGVAKNKFTGTPLDFEILRGKSKNPLFVTSIGIDNTIAKNLILSMHGNNRIPTLIKSVDRVCRDAIT